MQKIDAALIIATVIAISASSPAMAKEAKSLSSGKLYEHSVTGVHIKEGKITAKKTSKPNPSEINVTKSTDKGSAR